MIRSKLGLRVFLRKEPRTCGGVKTMTYDELYTASRAFFEANATSEQLTLLDRHEKCDGAGFVDSVLLFIDLFLGYLPGVPEKLPSGRQS